MEAQDFGAAETEATAQARADTSIADALTALDAREAEQVFHRALELEAEALEQPHLFTQEQLESIADEIDMDVAFVRQAIGEVRLSPADRSWLERKILPEAIVAVETVDGLPRADLDALIDDWMTGREGLIAAANLTDGRQWDVDRRWTSRLRASRLSGGNRISRVAGGDVTHRVQTIGTDEHVIAMQSEGEGPLLLAKLGLAGAAALIVAGLIGGLSATPVEFAQGMAALTAAATIVGGGAVVAARRWAKGIGRALRRSLTGLAGRIGGRGTRRHRDGVDLKPIVGRLLESLTERVRQQRGARSAAGGTRDRRPPPPPPRR